MKDWRAQLSSVNGGKDCSVIGDALFAQGSRCYWKDDS
jgi:hypothetical protein